MRSFLRLFPLILATAFAVLPSSGAAQNFLTYTVLTDNKSANRAWITIQDLGKTRNLDYGWVEPGKVHVWGAGNYTLGGWYYVRFEFMGANGKRVCDTRAQFTIAKGASHSKIGTFATGYYDPARGSCSIGIARPGPI
jgi:hypothetical protein